MTALIRRYRYDPAGQLITADTPQRDPDIRLRPRRSADHRNRALTDSSPTPTTPPANSVNAAVAADITQYTYDAAGRRVTETSPELTRTFTWNPLGHLDSIHRQARPANPPPHLTVDAFGDLAAINDTPLAWDPTGLIPQLRCLGDTTIIGDNEQAWATIDPSGAVSWLDADWQHSTNTTDIPGTPGAPPVTTRTRAPHATAGLARRARTSTG